MKNQRGVIQLALVGIFAFAVSAGQWWRSQPGHTPLDVRKAYVDEAVAQTNACQGFPEAELIDRAQDGIDAADRDWWRDQLSIRKCRSTIAISKIGDTDPVRASLLDGIDLGAKAEVLPDPVVTPVLPQ